MSYTESITDIIARLRGVCGGATPGPWFSEDVPHQDPERCHAVVRSEELESGTELFDTLNRGYKVSLIDRDMHDEDGKFYDLRGKKDLDFAATARAILPAALDCVEALAEVSTYLKSGMLCVDEPPAIRARIALAKFQKAAEK